MSYMHERLLDTPPTASLLRENARALLVRRDLLGAVSDRNSWGDFFFVVAFLFLSRRFSRAHTHPTSSFEYRRVSQTRGVVVFATLCVAKIHIPATCHMRRSKLERKWKTLGRA